mgnify:CR=1 FL=1
MDVRTLGYEARLASRRVASALTAEKNQALLLMADALERRMGEVLQENVADVAAARKKGLSASELDRLLLDEHRVDEMVQGLRVLAGLPDPVGVVTEGWRTVTGLGVEIKRVPFGVVAVVYESRPNVTVDAAAVCLKAGNAVILRGGSHAYASNRILAEVITGAVLESGLPGSCIQFFPYREREALVDLMKLSGVVDLLVARGGIDLREFVVDNSRIPVIFASVGNCHIYVDRAADLTQAVSITLNAKLSRPGVCNSAETLLVHESVAEAFLPHVIAELQDRKVTIYACERTRSMLGETGQLLNPATEDQYAMEFLGPELAVRVVSSLAEAIEHIGRYGTGHSEAIVTRDLEAARRFAGEVDAAAVYVNASTRLTDGASFGLGSEIGIATQKLHTRGPLTLQALTTTKYVVTGNGHTR